MPVYVPERFSKAARQAVKTAEQIPFNQLHQLEVRNAFELLVGRNLITRDECREILEQLHEDLDTQRLVALSLDLDPCRESQRSRSRGHQAPPAAEEALTEPHWPVVPSLADPGQSVVGDDLTHSTARDS